MTKPKRYWNKKNCELAASKCFKIKDFEKNYKGAYMSSKKNNWFDDICSHMRRYNKKWDKEQCHKEALKYSSRTEFRKKSLHIYRLSMKMGIMNEICYHMKFIGNLYKRCVYVYEFYDNSAYIGLTYDIDNRQRRHLTDKKSPVFKKIDQNIGYQFKKLTDYIEVNSAKLSENDYVKKYENENWKILNKNKTGGVGANFSKYSFEKCRKEALKYKTKMEFFKNSRSTYLASKRNKWFDLVCEHMIQRKININPRGYWTKERCQEEALKYERRSDFQFNSVGYQVSQKKGWLNEICSHMK